MGRIKRQREERAHRRQPGRRPQTCSGYQLDHRDGSMSCSRGLDCPGVALPHQGWGDCEVFGPCAHCEGPPVVWVH